MARLAHRIACLLVVMVLSAVRPGSSASASSPSVGLRSRTAWTHDGGLLISTQVFHGDDGAAPVVGQLSIAVPVQAWIEVLDVKLVSESAKALQPGGAVSMALASGELTTVWSLVRFPQNEPLAITLTFDAGTVQASERIDIDPTQPRSRVIFLRKAASGDPFVLPPRSRFVSHRAPAIGQIESSDLPGHIYKVATPGFDPGNMAGHAEANDSVNSFSGALQLTYVDLSLPGKAGLDLSVVRTFSSKYGPMLSDDPWDESPAVDSVLGLGWTLRVAPELEPGGIDACTPLTPPYFRVHDVDGSIYNLLPWGQAGYYISSNFWRLRLVGSHCSYDAYLYSPTGRVFHYASNHSRVEAWWYRWGDFVFRIMVPLSIRDNAGNQITISYSDVDALPDPIDFWSLNRQGRIRSITDSYGRVVEFSYDDFDPRPDGRRYPPRLTQIDVAIAGITLSYGGSHYSVAPHFNHLDSFTDGEFQTNYDHYGVNHAWERLLWRVTLPSGATVSYDVWELEHTFAGAMVNGLQTPVLRQRRVSTDLQPTTYQYPTGSSQQTIISDPGGNRTEIHHNDYSESSAAKIGTLRKTRRYQGSGGLLEEVSTTVTAVPAGPNVTDTEFPTQPLGDGRLEKTTVKRNGVTIRETTETSFDAHGNAQSVIDSGIGGAYLELALEFDQRISLFNGIPDNDVYVVHGLETLRHEVSGNPGFKTVRTYTSTGQLRTTQVTEGVAHPGDRLVLLDYYSGGSNNGFLKSITWRGNPAIPADDRHLYMDEYQWGVASLERDDIDLSHSTSIRRSIRPDGQIGSMTDRNHQVTSFTYATPARLLTGITYPRGAALTIEYPSDWRNTHRAIARRGSSQTTYELDDQLRVSETVTSTSTGSDVTRTKVTYDELGRVAKRYMPVASGTFDAHTSFAYDALGRVVQETFDFPFGPNADQTTRTTYTGANATVIDPKHRQTTLVSDGFGRLISATPPEGDGATYSYDNFGNLTSVHQGNLNPRTWAYSQSGLLLSESHSESGRTTFGYDRQGERTSRSQGGLTIGYMSDKRSRLTQITYPDAGRTATVFSYDTGCSTGGNCQDRMTGITDETGATDFLSYDANGNLESKHIHTDWIDYDVRYSYDEVDRAATVTYPSGRIIEVTHDPAGRSTVVQQRVSGDPLSTLVGPVSYNPSARPLTLPFGSGLTETISYDEKLRTTAVQIGAHLGLGYRLYDDVDNLKEVDVTGVGSENQTFLYDGVDQLTQATFTPGGRLTYRYDRTGNRYERTSTVSGVAGYQHEVERATNRFADQRHDSRGNVIDDGAHTFEYTSDNHLRSVDGRVFYRYNGLGQRVRRETSGGATYVYHMEGASVVSTWRVSPGGSSQPTAPSQAASELRYLHGDHVGTVRLVTDEDGDWTEWRNPGPFGELRTEEVLSEQGTMLFGGKLRDPTSVLEYYLARDYASGLGRFLTTDPLGSGNPSRPYTWNGYSFVWGNPLRFVDPDGRFPRVPVISSALEYVDAHLSKAKRGFDDWWDEHVTRTAARGLNEVGPTVDEAYGGRLYRTTEGIEDISTIAREGVWNVGMMVAAEGGPRLLAALTASTKARFIANATRPERGGTTPIGRALQSHAVRIGSAFPGATAGNAAENTQAGLRYLTEILEDPGSQIVPDIHTTFGDVIKLRRPDGSGVWFRGSGEFIGFLERYTKR